MASTAAVSTPFLRYEPTIPTTLLMDIPLNARGVYPGDGLAGVIYLTLRVQGIRLVSM
jgi:hypothetical protein